MAYVKARGLTIGQEWASGDEAASAGQRSADEESSDEEVINPRHINLFCRSHGGGEVIVGQGHIGGLLNNSKRPFGG